MASICKISPRSTNSSDTERERHLNKRPWTPEEDVQILALVAKYGPNWVQVSSNVAGRSGKQCRERYYNHLQDNIKKGDWSFEEDQQILRLQRKFGNHWVKIMRELPGRTDNAVKNRYHALQRAHTKIIEDYPAHCSEDTDSKLKKLNRGLKMSPKYDAEIPTTPTTVTALHTPVSSDTPRRAQKRVFTWKGVNVECIPEECSSSDGESESSSINGDAEADDSMGIQVDIRDVSNVLDCLSPLMVTPLRLASKQSGVISASELVPEVAEQGSAAVELELEQEGSVEDYCSLTGTDSEWSSGVSEADDEKDLIEFPKLEHEEAERMAMEKSAAASPPVISLSGTPLGEEGECDICFELPADESLAQVEPTLDFSDSQKLDLISLLGSSGDLDAIRVEQEPQLLNSTVESEDCVIAAQPPFLMALRSPSEQNLNMSFSMSMGAGSFSVNPSPVYKRTRVGGTPVGLVTAELADEWISSE